MFKRAFFYSLCLAASCALQFAAAAQSSQAKSKAKPSGSLPPGPVLSAGPKQAAERAGRLHRSKKQPPLESRDLEVRSLEHFSREGWIGGGSAIRVAVRGTPAAEAAFDIPGLVQGVKLREESAGVYAARFEVPISKYVCLDGAAIIGYLRGGGRISRPAGSGRLLRIDAAPPVIERIYPEPSARVIRPQTPIVAAVTDHNGSGIAARKTVLLIDGQDMSQYAVYTEGLLSYASPFDLDAGEHTVELMVFDEAGNMGSRTWRFTVMESQYAIRTVKTNADRVFTAGDVLTAVVEGAWGGRMVLVVGDSVEVPLKEQSPGFYEGAYTVPREAAGPIPLMVRFTSAQKTEYTEILESSIRVWQPAPAAPTISSLPTVPAPDGTFIVRGRAAPRSTVRVRIACSLNLNGRVLRGVVAEQHVRVAGTGAWESKPIPTSAMLARAQARLTIEAEAVNDGGERSTAATAALTLTQ